MQRRHFLYNTGCGIIGAAILPGQVFADGLIQHQYIILEQFLCAIEATEYHIDGMKDTNHKVFETQNQLAKVGYTIYGKDLYCTGYFLLQPWVLKADDRLIDYVVLIACKDHDRYHYSGQLTSGFIRFCVENKHNLVDIHSKDVPFSDIILPTSAIPPRQFGASSFMTKNGQVHVYEKVGATGRQILVQIDKGNEKLWEGALTVPCEFIIC